MALLPRLSRATIVALFAAAMLSVGFSATPAQASASIAELERDFAALVNIERAEAGMGSVTIRADIRTVARAHSRVMAEEWRLFHNPDYSKQITNWQRVSENVGYGPSVAAIHRALMNSEGHRRNILDDRVTEVGIGVVVNDGRVWVTQNFRRPLSNVTIPPPSTTRYGDVASTNVHAPSIETVSVRGIVGACSIARYCPSSAVTRGEFATMLVRALSLPTGAAGASRFSDVSGETATAVESLAAAGLTAGCGNGRFCPDRELTREQLATFFANALDLPPRSTSFTDVGRTHSGSVGALQHAGISNGCSATRYCPLKDVNRAQTASMIANNLR